MWSLLRLIRPKQWLKNVFVLFPLGFSQELLSVDSILLSLAGFAVFSLVASTCYVINDWCDIRADRAHPEKLNRPLASGAVSKPQAAIMILIMLVATAGIMVGIDANWLLVATMGFYALQSVAYSLGLKHVPILELFIVANGYVLRVMAGCYVLGVEPSGWIISASATLALLMITGKRRVDVVNNANADRFRLVLRRYTVELMDQIITICATITIMAYMLFTISPYAVDRYGDRPLIFTSVFVSFGVIRYLYLINTERKVSDPTELVIKDKPLLLCGLIWALTLFGLIYLPGL